MSMTKGELLKVASDLEIDITDKATKQDIIDLIEKRSD